MWLVTLAEILLPWNDMYAVENKGLADKEEEKFEGSRRLTT